MVSQMGSYWLENRHIWRRTPPLPFNVRIIWTFVIVWKVKELLQTCPHLCFSRGAKRPTASAAVEQQSCTTKLGPVLQPLQLWLISTRLFPPAKVKPGVMERRVPKVKKVLSEWFPHQFQLAEPICLQRWFKSANFQSRKWRLGVLKALKGNSRRPGCSQANGELLDDCSRATVSVSTVSKRVISVQWRFKQRPN